MRSSITSIAVALAVALTVALAAAGCGASEKSPAPPPLAGETPPATKDPGAVIDEPSLQPSPPPAPEGKGAGSGAGAGSGEQSTGRPDGAACLAPTDCASGVCEGEGCSETRPGTCAPKSRACTRDLRQYCSCDGKTFGASGTCPGRRYASAGRCK